MESVTSTKSKERVFRLEELPRECACDLGWPIRVLLIQVSMPIQERAYDLNQANYQFLWDLAEAQLSLGQLFFWVIHY